MKHVYQLILLITLSLVGIIGVSAEEADGTCDYAKQNELNKIASNIKVSYEVSPEPDLYFTVNIFNLTEDVYIVVSDDNTRARTEYNYTEENKGNISIRSDEIYKKVEFTIEVFPRYVSCANNNLRNITISTPRFNPYYSSYLCDDIKEYSLCQKWSDFEISFEDFKKRIDEYKISLTKEEEKTQDEADVSLMDKLVDFVLDNYILIMASGAIIVGGAVAGIITIRKRRII